MSAQRLRSFRFGDTDERMAEAMLSMLAFTTSVRREDDVGHDFICVLIQRDGDNLLAGSSFAVQIKSHTQRNKFLYQNENETRWLETQETPFFIGLTYRDQQRLDLYSTWNIHNSYLNCRSKSYHLIPGDPDANVELPSPREKPDCAKSQIIPLGRPLLSLTFADLVDEDILENSRQILREWILFERQNLVRRELKMHWINGPIQYETNKPLSSSFATYLRTVYWNANHYSSCLENFTRTATSLRNTMNRCAPREIDSEGAWRRRIIALENVIASFWPDLESTARRALKSELGSDLAPRNENLETEDLLRDFFEQMAQEGKLSELWTNEDLKRLLEVLAPCLPESDANERH